MHINLEAADPHSVQAYSDKGIQVNAITYRNSVVISSQGVITDWPINNIHQLNEKNLEPLLRYQPKIIIIGHSQQGQLAPLPIIQSLAKQRIGLECMSIGAACRTFNVLLSEQREVVLGVIF